MIDPSQNADPESSPADQLRRTYAAILEQENWEVDGEIDLLASLNAPPIPDEPEPIESPPSASIAEAIPQTIAPTIPPAAQSSTSLLFPSTITVSEEVPPSPLQLVEAILFVGGDPLTAERACAIIRGLTPDHFLLLIDQLNRRYRTQNRPYRVERIGDGHLIDLRSRYRPVRARLEGSPREARLSPVALDVLALVAYRQPVDRATIDSVRGADSAVTLRQLVRLGLIALSRHVREGERIATYATTARFWNYSAFEASKIYPDWAMHNDCERVHYQQPTSIR